jgi:PEGA domain
MKRSLAESVLVVCFLVLLVIAGKTSVAQNNGAQAAPSSQTSPASAVKGNSAAKDESSVGVNVTSLKGFVLEEGTPVKMRINRTVSSSDAHTGDNVDFEVLEDVSVNGTLVIAKGGLAFATVTEAQAKRRMARGGKLDINIDYVKLIDGEKAALRAVKEVKGGGHTGAMTGGIVATSLVFFPAAPFFLFMHGKDITIPKGTEITAYINGDMKLELAKFQQPGTVNSIQTAGAISIAPAAVSSAKIQLESTPPGADIQLDGSFVGNTPSDVQVPEGEHGIVIKKAGFKDWERKLKVSAGSTIRLDAEMEKLPNP